MMRPLKIIVRQPWSFMVVLIATTACGSDPTPMKAASSSGERQKHHVEMVDAGRIDAGRIDAGRIDAGKLEGTTHNQTSDEDDAAIGEADAGKDADDDLTFVMRGHVDAGHELQNCRSIRLPLHRGPIAVHSAESHYTIGSHHFLVYRVAPRELTKEERTAHLCTPEEEGGDFSPTYYEAQAPDSSRVLPDGVSHVFQPGEILLLTSHYLNTTEQDLDTEVKFTLHTVPSNEVQQEAGSIFFYNPYISIPAGMRVTTTRSCPIPGDINLALLWSHMHSRGVTFIAQTNDASAEGLLGLLYTSNDWSEPTPREYPAQPPVTLHAGSNIVYSCTFENRTDGTIEQGLSARTNEMCILHGMYWPRVDPATETCLMGTSTSSKPAALK